MGDAHLRRAFRRAGARTSSTAATSPRARPASRSPSTCPRRRATTRTTSLARGEVGKVGVSIAHKGDMHALLDGIPLDEMNTSMTINATAAWLLGLYVDGRRGERRRPRASSRARPRTTSSRSTSRAAPTPSRPEPSMRLIADTVAFTRQRDPELEPDQRLQLPPAGGRARRRCRRSPTRSSTAIAVLDEVKARGQVAEEDFPKVFGRISLLRQRRRPLHRGAREAAGDGRDVGADRAQPLRRHRPEAPADALRRAGQLARAHRGAAREQRPADRPRGAGGDARAATPAPARSSSPPGTRRSASRGRGTSSGACGSSRSSPTRPTCSTTPTSSRARR